MSVTVDLRVVGQHLEPTTKHDSYLVETLGGGEVRAKITKGRSSRHNSWYWAGLHRVIDTTGASERWPTPRHLHSWLLMETGHCAEVWLPAERCKVLIPDSTAFDRMPQEAFATYTHAADALLRRETGIGFEVE